MPLLVNLSIGQGRTPQIISSVCGGFDVAASVTNASCEADNGSINLQISTDGTTYVNGDNSYTYTWKKDGVDFNTGNCNLGNCQSLSTGIYEVTVTDNNQRAVKRTVAVGAAPNWEANSAITINNDGSLSRIPTSGLVATQTKTTVAQDANEFIKLKIDREDLLSTYYIGFTTQATVTSESDLDAYLFYDQGTIYAKGVGLLGVNADPDRKLIGIARVGDEFTIRRAGGRLSIYNGSYEVIGVDNNTAAYKIGTVISGQTHAISTSICASECSPIWVNQGRVTVAADGTVSTSNIYGGGASSLGILKGDEDGEIGVFIDQVTTADRYYIGLAPKDNSHFKLETAAQIYYRNGTLFFQGPTGNTGNIPAVAGDVFYLRKEGNTVNYYRNDETSPLASINIATDVDYIADLYVVDGQTHNIQTSFCKGFDVQGVVSDATCGLNDGSIALTISTNGLSYAVDENYEYKWIDELGTVIGGDVSALNNLAAGKYSVEVSDAAGRTRTETFTVGHPIQWLSDVYITSNADLTYSKNFPDYGTVSTKSFGVLPSGASGYLVVRMVREDDTSGSSVLFRSEEQPYVTDENGDVQENIFGVVVSNGAVRFLAPFCNEDLGLIRLGDEVRIMRDATGFKLSINDLLIKEYSGANYMGAYSAELHISDGQTQQIVSSLCTGFDARGITTNTVCDANGGRIELELSEDGITYMPAGAASGTYTYDWTKDGVAFTSPDCVDGICDKLTIGVYGVTVRDNAGHARHLTYTIGEQPQWESNPDISLNVDGTLTNTASGGRVSTVSSNLLRVNAESFISLKIDREDLNSVYYIGLTKESVLATDQTVRGQFLVYFEYERGFIRAWKGVSSPAPRLVHVGDEFTIRRVDGRIVMYDGDREITSLDDPNEEYRVGLQIVGGQTHPIHVNLCKDGCRPIWVNQGRVSVVANGTVSTSNIYGGGASSLGILKGDEDGEIGVFIDQVTTTDRYYIGLAPKDNSHFKLETAAQIYYRNGAVYFRGPTGITGNIPAVAGDVFYLRKEGNTVNYYRNDETSPITSINIATDVDYIADLYVVDGQTHEIRTSFCQGFDVQGVVSEATCGLNDGSIALTISTDGSSYAVDESYEYKWIDESGTVIGGDVSTLNNLTAGKYTVEVSDADGRTRTESFTVGHSMQWLSDVYITSNPDLTYSKNSLAFGTVSTKSLSVLPSGESGTLVVRMVREDDTSASSVLLRSQEQPYVPDENGDAQENIFGVVVSNGAVRFIAPFCNEDLGLIRLGDEVRVMRDAIGFKLYINDLLIKEYSGANYMGAYGAELHISQGQTQQIVSTLCDGFDARGITTNSNCDANGGRIDLEVSINGIDYLAAGGGYTYNWTKDGVAFTSPDCVDGICDKLTAGVYGVTIRDNSTNYVRHLTYTIGTQPLWENNPDINLSTDGTLTNTASSGRVSTVSSNLLPVNAESFVSLKIDRQDLNSIYYIGLTTESSLVTNQNVRDQFLVYFDYEKGFVRARGGNVTLSSAPPKLVHVGDEFTIRRVGGRIVMYDGDREMASLDDPNEEYRVGLQIVGGQTHPIHMDIPAIHSISTAKTNLCGFESTVLQVENHLLATGDQYKWYRDGVEFATTTSDQLIVNDDDAGAFAVSILAAANCESSLSNELVITHNPKPIITVAHTSANNSCAGSDATVLLTVANESEIEGAITILYEAGTEVKTLTLEEGINSIDLATEPLNKSTTFTLVSVSTENGCIATNLGEPVTVLVQPAITVNLALTNTSFVCAGEEVQLKLDFNKAGPFELVYELGGQNTTVKDVYDGSVITIPTSTGGANTLSVVSITDKSIENGCTNPSTASIDLNVLPLPTVSFKDTHLDICYGDPATLTLENFNGQAIYELTYSDGDAQYTKEINSGDVTTGAFTFVLGEEATSDQPATPKVSTVYQMISLKDASGCQNNQMEDFLSVSVNGLPNGFLKASKQIYCGDETIMLEFQKTYPLNNDPVTIQYTDGLNMYTYTAPTPGSFIEILPVDPLFPASVFKAYDPDDLGGINLRADETVPFSPLTIFRLVSIETVKREGGVIVQEGGTDVKLKSQGLAGKVEVTINQQPEAALIEPADICQGEALNLQFSFTKGTAPFHVEVREVIGANPPVIHEFFGLTDGDIRSFSPNENVTYELVKVTDAVDCELNSGFSPVAVVVHDLPTGTLTGIPSSAICNGTEVSFTAQASQGLAPYQMRYTDGSAVFEAALNATPFESAQVVSPVATTKFEILSIIDANGCAAEVSTLPSQEVIVNAKPVIALSTTRDCENGNTELLLSATSGIPPFTVNYERNALAAIPAYTLDGMLGILATETAVNTNYKMTSVTDANGCEMDLVTTPIEQTVNGLQVKLVASQTEVCEGESVNFTIKVIDGCTPFDLEYSDGTSTAPLTNVVDGTSFSVNPPVGGATYSISTIAGSVYADANAVIITTSTPLAAPSNLVATENVEKQLQLTWDDQIGEESYLISRKLSTDTEFAALATVPQDIVMYTDQTASVGKSYDYVVQAKSGVCFSPNSNVVAKAIYQKSFLSPKLHDEMCLKQVNTIMWTGEFEHDASLMTLTWQEVDEQGNDTGNSGVVADNLPDNTTFVDWDMTDIATVGVTAGRYYLKLTNESNEESQSQVFQVIDDCIEPVGNDRNWYHAELHPSLDEQFHITNGIKLRFRLEEKYVDHQTASIAIYDWKNQAIEGFTGNQRLMKYYGHNFYSIDLEELAALTGTAPVMTENQHYILEVKDEVNNDSKYLRFKYQKAAEFDIAINVVPTGTNMCDVAGTPSITFVPELVQNGTERYQVEWYFGTTSDFDAATKQELQKDASGTALKSGWLTRQQVEGADGGNQVTSEAEFRVNEPFHTNSYFVFLKVTDSCGNEIIKGVEVKCENNDVNSQNSFDVSIINVNTNDGT
ncbi:MAG: hypothetical protein ACPGJS_10995 [Flammeovirgaceae bacterium]